MPVYEQDGVWYPVPRPIPLYHVIRGALLNALAYAEGSHRQAARLLGIPRTTFLYHLQRYGIARRRVRARRRLPLRRVK